MKLIYYILSNICLLEIYIALEMKYTFCIVLGIILFIVLIALITKPKLGEI